MNVCDDMPKIPLPQYLQEHKKEILHIFDDATGWDYNRECWQSHFADDRIVSDGLIRIEEKCPDKICREDVRYFASEVRCGGYEELRRLFLACMIWGYGADPNGPENVKQAFSNSGQLKEVLEKSLERIKNAQIKEAYEGFNLKGCRSAFFTKFFYFVGREYNIKPLPLILDSHVANFLEFLSKDKKGGFELSKFVKVDGRKKGRISSVVNYSEGYIQYVCSMDDWARELGCPAADNIEYFMFKEDRKTMDSRTGRKKNHDFSLPKAKKFSLKHKLISEVNIIEAMKKPKSWDIAIHSGIAGSKYWFVRLRRVNYMLLWRCKGILEEWESEEGETAEVRQQNRFVKALKNFLSTPEGINWQNRNNPAWLKHPLSGQQPVAASGTLESMEISLPTQQKAQLEEIAKEFGVKDGPALARIWILEHLRQLH